MTTRLGLYGGPRQDYGALSPKTEIAVAKSSEITRLGLYGGPRQYYGDFAPKIEGIVTPSDVKKVRRFISNVSRMGLR